MGERLKTAAIAAGAFLVVTVIMCVAASFMMKSDESASAQAEKPQEEVTESYAEASAPTPEPVVQPTAEPTPEPTPEVTEAPKVKAKIAIDAGHQKTADSSKEPVGPGASETRVRVTGGTSGVSSHVAEHRLTLDVALKLQSFLEGSGYEVYMLRDSEDVNISDSERAILANDSKADVVLHIHANADERPEIKGIMAFVPSAENPYAGALHDSSAEIASGILDSMQALTGAKNWGVISNDRLSTLNYSKIPVVHIELGYMTNSEEDKLMQDEDYQNKLVRGIASGLDVHFGE